MKTKNQLRQEFNVRTLILAYRKLKTKHPIITPALFDAGKLGYCLLHNAGFKWTNTWFDKPIKLPPND